MCMENGLIYISIKDFSLKELLYPIDKLKLNTLDDTRKLEFKLNDKGDCLGFDIDWNGYKFKTEKLGQ